MVRCLAVLALALVAAAHVAAFETAPSSALRGSAETRALQASPDRLRPWPTKKKVVSDEAVDTRALQQEDSPDRRRYSEPTEVVGDDTRALQASPDRLRPWPTKKKVVSDEAAA